MTGKQAALFQAARDVEEMAGLIERFDELYQKVYNVFDRLPGIPSQYFDLLDERESGKLDELSCLLVNYSDQDGDNNDG